MEDVKREDELITKAKAGQLQEKVEKVVPDKGPGIRTFNVYVEDEYYRVEVESTGAVAVSGPVAGVTATAASVAAPKPAAAPAPARAVGPAPSAVGEGEIAVVLAELAAVVGLDVTVQEVLPGRPNVVGVLKGTGRSRSLMFNGHTDTVGVEGMVEPYSAAIREGNLYGRGSQDMKASLAAMLGAAKAIVGMRKETHKYNAL